MTIDFGLAMQSTEHFMVDAGAMQNQQRTTTATVQNRVASVPPSILIINKATIKGCYWLFPNKGINKKDCGLRADHFFLFIVSLRFDRFTILKFSFVFFLSLHFLRFLFCKITSLTT